MTSIRERYKQAAAKQSGNFVKLNIDKRFGVKSDTDGVVKFTYYDKEKGNIMFASPITGILIGHAMQATWYDSSIGNKGGHWFTGYYCTKDKVTLFKPSQGGPEAVMTGTFEEIEQYLLSRGVRANPRKYQALFLRIKGKDGSTSTVAVHTSLIIAISEQKKFDRNVRFDKMCTLTPKLYVPGILSDAKVKESTVNLMNTNPPKYASISFEKDINDVEFDSWGAAEAIDNYNEWMKANGGAVGEATQTAESVLDVPAGTVADFAPPSAEHEYDDFSGGDDDLPF